MNKTKQSIIEEAKKEAEELFGLIAIIKPNGDVTFLVKWLESQIAKAYKQGCLDALEASRVEMKEIADDEDGSFINLGQVIRMNPSVFMKGGFNEAVSEQERLSKEFLESV